MAKSQKYKTQDLYVTQHNMLARSVSNLTQDGQALLMTALALHDYEGEIGQEIFISNADFIDAIPSYTSQTVVRALLAAKKNLYGTIIEFNQEESDRFLDGMVIRMGPDDIRDVSWIEECVIRKSGNRTLGVAITLNRKLKPLLTGVLKDGQYTRVRFKNVAAIIGQKKNSISVGAVALYLHLSSWQGRRNKQGGYTVKINLDELKRITRSGSAEYNNFKKKTLVNVLDLINTCTDLAVRFDEIKHGRKVLGINFGCGSEVIVNTKPQRLRLKPKPRISDNPEYLWNWANYNLKLLLAYRQELKVYNSDLDLTTADIERVAKYYFVTNDEERCNFWTNILFERKAKLAEQSKAKLVDKEFNGFKMTELLEYYELLSLPLDEFTQSDSTSTIPTNAVEMFMGSASEIYDVLGVREPTARDSFFMNAMTARLAKVYNI